MPIYDLDEEKTAFEPLKIKLDDKVLVIEDVDKKEFDVITEIKDPHEQLAAWAKIDVKELEQIKMQKVAVALKIIGRELLGPAVGNFTPKKT